LIIGGRTCRTCEHSHEIRPPGGPPQVFCTRFPPQVFALAIPGPRGGSQVNVNATYPLVNPEIPCGEYRRSEVKAMAEVGPAGRTQ
jgi:hypothetical protein